MNVKAFLLLASVLGGTCFSALSQAACDAECRVEAMDTGDSAAQKLFFKEISQSGKLGQLLRVEVGLDVCGTKGKGEAISKLRKQRFHEIVERRVKEAPIGSDQDPEDMQAVEFASFLSTIQALKLGYALGYKESAQSSAGTSQATKALMCKAYNAAADKVLFGDSPR